MFGFKVPHAAVSVVCLLVVLVTGCGTPTPAPVSQRDLSAQADRQKIKKGGYYKVVAGDTLYSIAWRAGLDYRNLGKWNHIFAPYKIYVGQKLRIAPPAKKKNRSGTSRRRKLATRKAGYPARRSTGSQTQTRTKSRDPVKAKAKRKIAVPLKPASSNALAWHWPTRGRLVQTFSKTDRTRQGINISGRFGQPVHATAGGKIVYTGSGLKGYGRLIIIKHNKNFLSAYGHNRKNLVREGDQVAGGEKIAEMGRSADGKSMLHFEIRRKGSPVNPVTLLPRRN